MNLHNYKNILDRIYALKDSLSPKQRILATFIVNNYKKAAFMNSIQLAKATGVSNSSVIRFATFIGYTGYAQMQQELQALLQSELSSIDRVNLLSSPKKRKTVKHEEFVIFEYEQENISSCLRQINPSLIQRASQLLFNARKVYITGFQVSDFLADYAYYTLSKIRANSFQFKDWDQFAFNTIQNSTESDVAFIIALPRYPNKTLQFVKEFFRKNIPIILITDSKLFPYCDMVDVLFTVSIKYYSYVDPLSSVMCLINSILIETAKISPENTRKNLNIFEKYVDENNIYFKK